MAFHVRDPETDRVVRELAAVKGATLTETIREVCSKALADTSAVAERERRLAAMQAVVDRVSGYPDTGVTIDKAFFDALNDE